MKAEKKVLAEVKLTLTIEEAEWLKTTVQNPICAGTTEKDFLDETVYQFKMRQTFWEALLTAGV